MIKPEDIKELMTILRKHKMNCFINHNYELIVEPKNNIFFRLDNVTESIELKAKVIEFLSRPAITGVGPYWQKRFRSVINQYLDTDFAQEDLEIIYTYLGGGICRTKTLAFIDSNYDLKVLLKN